jgi:hypothetical protein
VIVVCGDLAPSGGGASAGDVAVQAAGHGAVVEVIGVIPDGPDGDRRLLALAGAHVGHAAVLREPARALEPEDVDLALRYLPDIRVIVMLNASAEVLRVADEHGAWSGARLVALMVPTVEPAAGRAEALSDAAIVLQAPPTDRDGTFAGFVAAFSARLDEGATPADAWAATTRALAVDPA